MKSPYQFFGPIILSAGQRLEWAVQGNYFEILSNDSATNVKIRIEGDTEYDLPTGLGIKLPQSETYTRLEFRNPTLVDMTITFASSNGEFSDNRLVISGSVNTNDIGLNKALGLSSTFTTAQVTVPATANGIQIAAANANRRRITVKNPAGGQPVYLKKDNTVTTSNGHMLDGGESIELTTTDAIFGIVAAGTQLVTTLEE